MRAFAVVLFVSVLSSCELPVATGTCQGPQPFSIGSPVENVAFEDDCAGLHGLSGDVYAFTLAEHTGFLLEMDPTGFRAAFEVYQGAFGGAATPVRIAEGEGSGVIGARLFLPPGEYFVLAGPAEREGGNYQLSATAADLADCEYPAFAVRGSNIEGSVTLADCSAAPPRRQDIYEVLLPAGVALKAVARGNPQGFLLLRTGSASSADLAATGLDPNIADSLTYTTPTAGWYRVHVGSDPGTLGPMSYTLRVR